MIRRINARSSYNSTGQKGCNTNWEQDWWHCRSTYHGLGIRSLVTCGLSHFVVAFKALLFAMILGMILRCINVS